MKAPPKVFAFSDWRQRVGIEREYKWSFGVSEIAPRLAGRTVSAALRDLRLPDRFRAHEPYRHRQETAYLDDAWRLLDNESSIAVILNEGPTGQQSYLKAKQTIGWSGLRRDAVEIAEKVDPEAVPVAVSEHPALPVQYLSRQYGAALVLRPFAKTQQERWKLNVWSDHGAPLVVCWDECTITAVENGEREVAHCIEVETNMLDEESCDDLARLADLITEFLDAAPNTLSKSRRAAALCGR